MKDYQAIRLHMHDNAHRIETIKNFMENNKDADEKECNRNIWILEEVNKALAEIQQYRSMGTVEEIRSKMEELGRWHSDRLNSRIKNEFAAMSTLICHNCDHKDEYIEELEAETEEYRAIGTVEECRAAVEKQRAKKPIMKTDDGIESISGLSPYCPLCGCELTDRIPFDNKDFYFHCLNCGQKFDWSDSP